MPRLTRADVHEDGVGAIDVLVRERSLVIPVPQSQGDPIPLQLQPGGAGALAQAKQRSLCRHAGGNLDVLVLLALTQPQLPCPTCPQSC